MKQTTKSINEFEVLRNTELAAFKNRKVTTDRVPMSYRDRDMITPDFSSRISASVATLTANMV